MQLAGHAGQTDRQTDSQTDRQGPGEEKKGPAERRMVKMQTLKGEEEEEKEEGIRTANDKGSSHQIAQRKLFNGDRGRRPAVS